MASEVSNWQSTCTSSKKKFHPLQFIAEYHSTMAQLDNGEGMGGGVNRDDFCRNAMNNE